MADVVSLPTAAREPVVNHRRRGSYGRKVVSLNGRKWRRERANERANDAEGPNMVEALQEMCQLAADGKLRGIAFVFNLEGEHCQAGVAGSLKEDFALANRVWLKLNAEMWMAAHKDD